MEDQDAADPPLRTLNVFYQGTNVEMLEETYYKFKKNILPKMKKMQPDFQEPVIEYCEPEQVIDICSYNHYPILDKSSQNDKKYINDNDIYDTSELEHEFEYGIYEDVLKTEQLMAELKRIDEAENESKKLRDVQFGNFPLEQFSDAGKVANEGDPHLKAAANTELYDLEKHAIQIDIENTNMTIPVKILMTIPAHELTMILPAKELMTTPAKVLMMMITYYKLKLVTCKYLSAMKNTMLIMMIIHYVKWFTDQRMCHIMKTAKNCYCRK